MRRTALAPLLAVTLAALVVAPTLARQPVDPATLNPAPPDFFNATCREQGAGIVCDLAFSDPEIVDEPSGIVCDGVELLFSQTRDVVGKRFYDADGNLLQRHFREDMAGTLEHPTSGAIVEYVQASTVIHDLAEPGDLASGTTRVAGTGFRASIPGGATILVDAGWIMIDEATGELVDWAGPHALDDYFARGDLDALDAICDAVG